MPRTWISASQPCSHRHKACAQPSMQTTKRHGPLPVGGLVVGVGLQLRCGRPQRRVRNVEPGVDVKRLFGLERRADKGKRRSSATRWNIDIKVCKRVCLSYNTSTTTPPRSLKELHDEQPDLWREQRERCVVQCMYICICIAVDPTTTPELIFNHQHSKHCFPHVGVIKSVRALLPTERCAMQKLDRCLAGWQCVFPRQLCRRCG